MELGNQFNGWKWVYVAGRSPGEQGIMTSFNPQGEEAYCAFYGSREEALRDALKRGFVPVDPENIENGKGDRTGLQPIFLGHEELPGKKGIIVFNPFSPIGMDWILIRDKWFSRDKKEEAVKAEMYAIPMTKGTAFLQIPSDLKQEDINRIKKWIDLMAEALVVKDQKKDT